MRVLIFFPLDQKSLYNRLYRVLHKMHISITSSKIEHDGEVVGALLYKKLVKSTHVITIIDRGNLNENWFMFTIGFCLGNEKSLCVLPTEVIEEPPLYLKKAAFFESVEQIEVFFRKERDRFQAEIVKKDAYAALHESGIPVTEQGLFSSVVNGDREALDHFMAGGFSPELRNAKGVSLLAVAVRNGHEALVEKLIEYGAKLDTVSQDNGNSPLMDAISKGYKDIAILLIEEGADLDIRSKNGQTALILAIGQHQRETVNHLVQAGADTSLVDKLGMTARKYAELFGYQDILSILPYNICN